jgi:hypothetical protein
MAGFDPGPAAESLCKFQLPFLRFSFGFLIPPINFPPPLPIPFLSLGLSCNVNNPLNLSAGLKPGGGRTANLAPLPPETSDQP